MVIVLLLALVALWVTSALPLGVTALIIVVLCPVLGIVGKRMFVPNATVVALVGFGVMFFSGYAAAHLKRIPGRRAPALRGADRRRAICAVLEFGRAGGWRLRG